MNQGESSGSLSVQPMKRRRGRPRKDRSLNHATAAHPPPGLQGAKERLPQRADNTVGVDYMVGQTVTGVVEATFDAGYLLTVRIGDSSTNLRGVVFKPGHYVPVTAENDVAPHVQMIRRNNVHLPAQNQGSSRGQKLAMQTASVVPLKRKYAPPIIAPSVPPVGVRGTVVPVVLQPVNHPNGLPNSNQAPPSDVSQTSHMLAFGDKDVHVVEPISMLPPDRSIPAGQIFVTTQSHSGYQVAQGSEQNDNGSNEGASEVGQGDKPNPMTSTEIDSSDSSQMSDINIENGKETLKSSAEDSGIVTGNANGPFSTDSLQTASAAKPMFNYGVGRMTELLQAVQENMKDNLVQFAGQPISASESEFHETKEAETNPENDAKFSSPSL
ncbi:hypothetical protein ACJIZ3_006947 [Penstemon smallii]|uniref:Uncharacterized protein n=1 Tax=Penstemon smallii TaxID=265156 RepID=A0ABD3S981_9LAMI